MTVVHKTRRRWTLPTHTIVNHDISVLFGVSPAGQRWAIAKLFHVDMRGTLQQT